MFNHGVLFCSFKYSPPARHPGRHVGVAVGRREVAGVQSGASQCRPQGAVQAARRPREHLAYGGAVQRRGEILILEYSLP